jgi:sterol desaturase/sphingolipid hydroxylase (fatty acid hydroxylase superfamily)
VYSFTEGLLTHLAQPEGFVMLGGYLIGTWMFGLMPASYYSFSGGINWFHVAAQLLIQDGIQFVMHFLEHKLDPRIYKASHKPHHRFTNPKLFDAFNGSLADTFFMILVPLVITARLVNANVWSYMAFGSLYANWLTLIHCEHKHPWDGLFRTLGFGTAADHHVHHKLFKFNYGHLFM